MRIRTKLLTAPFFAVDAVTAQEGFLNPDGIKGKSTAPTHCHLFVSAATIRGTQLFHPSA